MKKQIQSKKKRYLSTAILFLILTITSLLLIPICMSQYQKSTYTYDELEYKEYTIEKIEKVPVQKDEWQNYVYVKEESKPLLVDTLLTSDSLSEALGALTVGDKIFCYANAKTNNADCSYELVELSEEKTVFSLDDFTRAYRQDTIIGLISILILTPVSAIITTVFFVLYFNKTKIKTTRIKSL